jgi:hypothetical protein
MSLDDDAPIEGRSPYLIRFPRHDWRLARNQLEAKRPCLTEQKALLEMKRRPGRLFYRKRDGFGLVRRWSL